MIIYIYFQFFYFNLFLPMHPDSFNAVEILIKNFPVDSRILARRRQCPRFNSGEGSLSDAVF